MKLIIVRHGDPDYEHDTLTEIGKVEAQLLAERFRQHPDIAAFYVSPLGRAQDTAAYTLHALRREAETLPWLREFHAPIQHPDTDDFRVPWDWLPDYWTREPAFYDRAHWAQTDIMLQYGVGDEAQRVYQGLDALLARHGYVRDGMIYRAVQPNMDTIVLFCHFGVECVMLAHLIGVSPMVLWQGLCAAPTAVTVLSTEERRAGAAAFRVNTFGDTGHLYAAGREPSFSARFCEMFENDAERHD